jgi:hypothetical protein
MSTTQLSTEPVEAPNQPAAILPDEATVPQARKTTGRLAVRSGIRAGAWEDIDDQVAAWWNNLTSQISGTTDTTSTPVA